MTNLATALVETSKEHGDRPALRLDDQVVTYERFLEAALKAERELQAIFRYGVSGWDVEGMTLSFFVAQLPSKLDMEEIHFLFAQ